MNYKLLMYWDVKPGTDEEYSEFVLREWMPGMEALGLQHSEAWLTLWPQQSGERPRIMTGGLLGKPSQSARHPEIQGVVNAL